MNSLLKRGLLIAVCLMPLVHLSAKAEDVEGNPIAYEQSGKEDAKICHNIFGELFGPSFGVGIGFDSRFKVGTPFGYRVGVSYAAGSFGDNQQWRDLDFNGVCFPLEINGIFGKRKSKFEIGAGVTPSILHRTLTTWYWKDDMSTDYVTTRKNKLNFLGTLNIGYRYQRERGFFLRAGLTICFGDLKYSPIDGVWVLPNLSLGYTLKY